MGVPLSKCTSADSNVPSTVSEVQQALLPVTKPTLPNPYGKDCDLHEVHERIFISGSIDADNLPLLRSAGITHVLNMAEGRSKRNPGPDARVYAMSGIVYMGIGAFDTPEYDLTQHFREVFAFMDDALYRRNGKILVHCLRGLSRSPTVVAAYLMQSQHLSAAEALTRLRRRRVIYPNAGFLRQLADFDVYLCNRRRLRRISTALM